MVLLFAVAPRLSSAVPPAYTIEEIGSAEDLLDPKAINESGVIVGDCVPRDTLVHSAFITREGKTTIVPPPDGFTHLFFADVNDKNVVVGTAIGENKSRVVLYADEKLTFLSKAGELPLATAIANSGVVVGIIDREDGHQNGAVWEHGRTTLVKPLEGDIASWAFVISATGKIVGWSAYSKGYRLCQADLSGNTIPLIDNDKWNRFRSMRPKAINPHGVVVGSSTAAGHYQACIIAEKVFAELPDLPKNRLDEFIYFLEKHKRAVQQSSAYDINDDGWVVGTCTTPVASVACLWIDDEVYRLDELVKTDEKWLFHSAVSLNNRGQIVGFGKRDGKETVFLLSPILTEKREQ
ncbi:hypothetical protein [Lignipirellula cremea]|uniref:Uncharacterized protein n=1 Tax=Lignipirellula cremea TaxID=2528010 RepID=A0A518DNF2_9BACT|nr:hypothetical protein [Lignipirellula cremea]QDU93343.1 hypothetical protein Pla8534_11230 [Lignipirellula cremea]